MSKAFALETMMSPQLSELGLMIAETLGDLLSFNGLEEMKMTEEGIRMTRYSYEGPMKYKDENDNKRRYDVPPVIEIIYCPHNWHPHYSSLSIELPAGNVSFRTRNRSDYGLIAKNFIALEISGKDRDSYPRSTKIFKEDGDSLNENHKAIMAELLDNGFKIYGYDTDFIKSRPQLA